MIIKIKERHFGHAAFSTNITLNAKGNVKEKSRIIRSWSNYTNYVFTPGVMEYHEWIADAPDFHNEIYREKIVTITFLDTNKVPNNALKSWDVSEAGDKGVMAYITTNSEESDKYDLFIGAKGGVVANENSDYLFFAFKSLKTVDLRLLDTSNTKTMAYMFSGYAKSKTDYVAPPITEIKGIENLVTSSAINIEGMFYECSSLTSLDLSGWDTRNITNMSSLFRGQDIGIADLHMQLTEIKGLTDWDVSKVENMMLMFYLNEKLTVLDLSKWKTESLTNSNRMFYCCTALKTIYVSENFITSKITDSEKMFQLNSSLVGGNGTKWNASYTDKTYARIDTASTPGYFTLKNN